MRVARLEISERINSVRLTSGSRHLWWLTERGNQSLDIAEFLRGWRSTDPRWFLKAI
jgi:hypothetical protein